MSSMSGSSYCPSCSFLNGALSYPVSQPKGAETSLAINAANTPRCSLIGSDDRIGSLGVLGCKSMRAIDAFPNRLSRTDALLLPGPAPIRPGRACLDLSGWDDEKTVQKNTATGKDGRNILRRMLILSLSTRGWLQLSEAFLLSQNVFARCPLDS
ncbi:hypothetical protein T05_1636 [Trichinella murrelli]|uniref:Uncharacterized protein n=1 Tax=Trichinella murrelli TaxID=144512 RepID=A0A0V0T4C5_9BILA|nr:hypothetical protein T05_1636 [Trichinella murrelli]